MSTTLKPFKSVCLLYWHAERMLVGTWVDLVLRHTLLLDLFPSCEFFIFPYPSSCYWQTPEHVLQAERALVWRAWKYIGNCRVYSSVIWFPPSEWKAKLQLQPHPPITWAGVYTNHLSSQSFSALFVLHPLEVCLSQDICLPWLFCIWSQPEAPQQLPALKDKQMMEKYALLRNSTLSAIFFCRKGSLGYQFKSLFSLWSMMKRTSEGLWLWLWIFGVEQVM